MLAFCRSLTHNRDMSSTRTPAQINTDLADTGYGFDDCIEADSGTYLEEVRYLEAGETVYVTLPDGSDVEVKRSHVVKSLKTLGLTV